MKIKKVIKKIIPPIKQLLRFFFLFFLLIGVGNSAFTFFVGFHNIDVCHNEINIEGMIAENVYHDFGVYYTLNLAEQKLNGEIWTLDDCYLDGLSKLVSGFSEGIVVAFLLGAYVCFLLRGGRK